MQYVQDIFPRISVTSEARSCICVWMSEFLSLVSIGMVILKSQNLLLIWGPSCEDFYNALGYPKHACDREGGEEKASRHATGQPEVWVLISVETEGCESHYGGAGGPAHGSGIGTEDARPKARGAYDRKTWGGSETKGNGEDRDDEAEEGGFKAEQCRIQVFSTVG
ncbi:hypothetical protein [Actinocorallia libanotica]|uniref:hypothetical protein n=1 Tax=Actinocorallia libanotica TaxID=46162 RepID=UPI0031D66198